MPVAEVACLGTAAELQHARGGCRAPARAAPAEAAKLRHAHGGGGGRAQARPAAQLRSARSGGGGAPTPVVVAAA